MTKSTQGAVPWWRVGMVWLVIGGPLAVVLAGIATAVIAFSGADTVVSTSSTPAMQARNHADGLIHMTRGAIKEHGEKVPGDAIGRAETAIADLEEEARRASVPPGWLR